MTGLRRVAMAIALLAGAPSRADESSARARPVFERARDAVITVRITSRSGVSYRGSGERGESVTEATGCVIHPSGLTALALSTFDASRRMSQAGPGGGAMRYESEVSDVTLILADSTEIPAEIVMRDPDLDLAYVRPLTPAAEPFVALSLSRTGRPEVLEPVVIVDRLGVIANRTPAARLTRITAIIDKPRWAGVVETSSATGIGAAVFTADGTLIGMVAMRSIRRDGNSRGPTVMSVIVPADELQEGARQALAVNRKPRKIR